MPAALLFEPSPWIMIPCFSDTGGVDTQGVERTTAVFTFSFTDGSITTIDPPALFADRLSSNHESLTARISPDQVATGGLEHVPATLLPNLHAAARSGGPYADDPQLRAWLRGMHDDYSLSGRPRRSMCAGPRLDRCDRR